MNDAGFPRWDLVDYDVALLDDDDDFCDLFARGARQAGLRARTERDPRRFIEAFESQPARVNLIDLDMADPFGVAWRFAGISTLIEFRRRHGDGNALWVLTGMQNPGLYSMCKKAGADDVLTKTLRLDAIIDRVKQAAEQSLYKDAMVPRGGDSPQSNSDEA